MSGLPFSGESPIFAMIGLPFSSGLPLFAVIGLLFLFLGTALLVAAVVGAWRMSDPFSKLQVQTKAGTLALMIIILGSFFLHPQEWTKLLLMALLVLLTHPIRSHSIAQAIYGGAERPPRSLKKGRKVNRDALDRSAGPDPDRRGRRERDP